ncbi:MAG: hypothetical protein ACNS61_04635 [Candidatus Wenzhouxiangella sp. M2_3B_020]|nr:hypothetical protein [Xanthomonadales bacterium]
MERVITIPRILFIALAALALVGCYESPDVTLHEPGVYKGEQDPLVKKLANDDELQAQLEQRFDGQRDR